MSSKKLIQATDQKNFNGRIESYLDCVLSVFIGFGGVTSFVTSSIIMSRFFLQKNMNTYFKTPCVIITTIYNN